MSIFKIIGITLIVLVVAGGIFIFTTVNSINKEYKPEEVVFGEDGKKALIIYEPSKQDTAKNVTEELGKSLAAQGYKVTINRPSKNLTYNLEDYDLIGFGSPVYMGQVSKVLEEYVKSNNVRNKDVFVYSVGKLMEEKSELEVMKSWIDESNNLKAVKFTKNEEEKIKEFAKKEY